jgi:hypothetical protein
MGAAIHRDRADRRAGVDAQKCGLAVNLGPDEQMILARTDQRQRLVLECAGVRAAQSRSKQQCGQPNEWRDSLSAKKAPWTRVAEHTTPAPAASVVF